MGFVSLGSSGYWVGSGGDLSCLGFVTKGESTAKSVIKTMSVVFLMWFSMFQFGPLYLTLAFTLLCSGGFLFVAR